MGIEISKNVLKARLVIKLLSGYFLAFHSINGGLLYIMTWRIPGTGEPGGLLSMASHSRTRLKRLSSSSSITKEAVKVSVCLLITGGFFSLFLF